MKHNSWFHNDISLLVYTCILIISKPHYHLLSPLHFHEFPPLHLVSLMFSWFCFDFGDPMSFIVVAYRSTGQGPLPGAWTPY